MSETFGYGFMFPNDQLGAFNPVAFIISQMLARVRTVTLGKVIGVTNSGTIIPAGTVDVNPLVSMVDGRGNAVPHGVVYKLPYFRLQSGANAIIMDPAVGDIGIMLICDRDVSSVEASQAAAPPPSMRMFSFSDGLFIGGVLGTVEPTQYLAFTAAGIVVGGNLIVNGNLQLSGSIEAVAGGPYAGDIKTSGNVTAGFGGADQVGLQTHEHPTAASGSPSPPTPGT
jgi:hypothetical protein